MLLPLEVLAGLEETLETQSWAWAAGIMSGTFFWHRSVATHGHLRCPAMTSSSLEPWAAPL